MVRATLLSCLGIALVLVGCKAKEKPVALDPVAAGKIDVGGSIIQRFVPQAGQTTAETEFKNQTDYEIASIAGELDLYDKSGNLVDHRDITYGIFIDSTTGFKGSLLPRSRAAGSATFPLENPNSYPSYRFVQKSVTYFKKGDDYNDPGHLFAAAARHDPALITVLERNPDLMKEKDPESQMTVLHQAAASDNLQVVQEAVKQGGGLDVAARNGQTPLFEALAGGASDVADVLIQSGANIGGIHNQQTALQMASANCSNEVIDALLQKGADPNQGSGNYPSPLIMAAAKGDIDLMKVLIGRGAKINTPNGNFGTVLHIAARTHNPALVQLLVDHGADVNAIIAPYRPVTPLMEAAAKGDGETIKILLAHGAKRDAQGPHGETAMQFAEQYGNQDAITALQANNK